MSDDHTPAVVEALKRLREVMGRRCEAVREVYDLTRRVCERLNGGLGDPEAIGVSEIEKGEWRIAVFGETVANCKVAMRARIKPGWSVQKTEVPLNFEVTTLKGADDGSLLGGTVTGAFEVSWFKVGEGASWCRLDEGRKDFVPVEMCWIESQLMAALLKHLDQLVNERDLKPPAWK